MCSTCSTDSTHLTSNSKPIIPYLEFLSSARQRRSETSMKCGMPIYIVHVNYDNIYHS